MPNINLLPWRDGLREQRKKEFLAVLVGVVVLSAGVVFMVDRYFRAEISTQQARNEYIRSEIRLLDARVEEINQLQEQKRQIRDRMNVIQDLQGSRPVIVRIFDELVKTLPSGVYFQTVERVNDNLNIVGVAENYGRLTDLMRQLDASPWFDEPDLQIISAADSEGFTANAANRFTLDLTLVTPRDYDQEFLITLE